MSDEKRGNSPLDALKLNPTRLLTLTKIGVDHIYDEMERQNERYESRRLTEGTEIPVHEEEVGNDTTFTKPGETPEQTQGGEIMTETDYNSAQELRDALEEGDVEGFDEYALAAQELQQEYDLELEEQYAITEGMMGLLSDETEVKVDHASEVREETEDLKRKARTVASWMTRFAREAADETDRYQETIEDLMYEFRTTVHAAGMNLEQVNDILDDAQSNLETTRDTLEGNGEEHRERFRENKEEHTDLRERMGYGSSQETEEE